MQKTELLLIIRKLVKQIMLGEKPEKEKPSAKFNATKFPIVLKFPKVDNSLTSLMTDDYGMFIKEIDWIAPRPTTFRIELNNGSVFYLVDTEKSLIAQVEGKKYYMEQNSDIQRASEAISRLLRFDYNINKEEEVESSSKPSKKDKEEAEISPEEEAELEA